MARYVECLPSLGANRQRAVAKVCARGCAGLRGVAHGCAWFRGVSKGCARLLRVARDFAWLRWFRGVAQGCAVLRAIALLSEIFNVARLSLSLLVRLSSLRPHRNRIQYASIR